MSRRVKVYFDGGCQPNPGQMETAVVVRGQAYFQRDLGTGSNNDAEWLALIHAVRIARELELQDYILLGDSQLVVNQATGVWRCKSPRLQTHFDRYAALSAAGAPHRVRHIKRAQNLAGIALARRGAFK